MSDRSTDTDVCREQLMEHYGFDCDQAEAIMEMSNNAFTIQAKEKAKEELQELMQIDNSDANEELNGE